MSDTRTPQEPGEELKRLVAEIVDDVIVSAMVMPGPLLEREARKIKAEGAQKIENYIQSRIPEVSEEAEMFADSIKSCFDGYYLTGEGAEKMLKFIAMRDKGREWKWRDIAEVLVQLKDDNCISHWGSTAAKAFKDARALLSEKS